MEEIDLKELIEYFFRKKFLIICVIVVFAILGVLYTKICITPLYEASTSLILVQTEFEGEEDVVVYSNLVNRYSVIASSRNVASKVIDNLKLDIAVDELQNSVTVTPLPTSYSLEINVTNINFENAAKIADETAKVFIEEVARIYEDEELQILDYAVTNSTPININLSKNIVKFSFVGAILICGYVLVCFMFLKTSEDKEVTEKDVEIANKNN